MCTLPGWCFILVILYLVKGFKNEEDEQEKKKYVLMLFSAKEGNALRQVVFGLSCQCIGLVRFNFDTTMLYIVKL